MGNINTRGHIVRANSEDVGCLQSIGNIKQSRGVIEYDCINTNTVIQAVGNVKTAPIALGVLYDPADAAGAKELETAFNDGTTIPFEIELSDIVTPTTGNGTTFAWTGAVISDFELEQQKDGKVLATFTVTLNGAPTVTAAA
jgi:hypothetical protein